MDETMGSDERTLVDSGISAPLAEGATYYAVSELWLSAWDAKLREDSKDPGPIDCSDIADAKHPECLQRGLLDGAGLRLLPKHVYDELAAKYSVRGPSFPRTCISRGGELVVELQPQLCIFSSSVDGSGQHRMLMSRTLRPGAVLNKVLGNREACEALGLSGPKDRSELRVWYAVEDEVQDTAVSGAVVVGSSLAQNGTIDANGLPGSDPISPTASELLWQPFVCPNIPNVDFIAGNAMTSRVLIERRNPDGTWSQGGDWPLRTGAAPVTDPSDAAELAAWRASLRAGSLLDACDKFNTWYDARVVAVNAPRTSTGGASAGNPGTNGTNGSSSTSTSGGSRVPSDVLTAHFFGWTSQYDMKEPRNSARFAPLHSQVPRWRQGLRAGDRVEASLDALVGKAIELALSRSGGRGVRRKTMEQPSPTDKWALCVVSGIDFTVDPPTLSVVFPARSWDLLSTSLSALPHGVSAPTDVLDATIPLIGSDEIARVGTHIGADEVGPKNFHTSWLPAYPREGLLGRTLPPLPPAPAAVEAANDCVLEIHAAWAAAHGGGPPGTAAAAVAAGASAPVSTPAAQDPAAAAPSPATTSSGFSATSQVLPGFAPATAPASGSPGKSGGLSMAAQAAIARATAAPAAAGSANGVSASSSSSGSSSAANWSPQLTSSSSSASSVVSGAAGIPVRPTSAASSGAAGAAARSSGISHSYNTRGSYAYSSYGGGEDEDEGAGAGGAAGREAHAVAQEERANRALDYYSQGSYGFYGSNRRAGGGGHHQPGVVGLTNMGNTCFMNSLLQCLSNTQLLTQYFASLAYCRDVNTHNPLGRGGKIAHAYGGLVRAMWSGEFATLAPRPVKDIVAKYAPQFEGWGQHDSQEFLTFLLDGLLEDTCRVHPKPFVPAVEAAPGQSDSEVAAAAWDAFQRRNSSAIGDIFAGQFRSRVECPQCSRTSITFDPFTCLSVPVPTLSHVAVNLLYFDSLGSPPVEYTWTWSRSSSHRALRYGDVARELLRRVRADARWVRGEAERSYGRGNTPADVPLDGTLAAAAPFTAPLPSSPSELLFTLANRHPCVLLNAMQHWIEYTPDKPQETNWFVYHLVNAGGSEGGSGSSGAAASGASTGGGTSTGAAAAASSASSSSFSSSGTSAGGSGAVGQPPNAKVQRVRAGEASSSSSSSSSSPLPPSLASHVAAAASSPSSFSDLSSFETRETLLEASKWRWYYDRSRPPPSMAAGAAEDGDEEEDGSSDEDAAAGAPAPARGPFSSGSAWVSADDDEEEDLMADVAKATVSPPRPAPAPASGSKRKTPLSSSPSGSAPLTSHVARRAVSTGPTAGDFVTVWIRYPATLHPFSDGGDSLIIPLRHPVSGRRITNAEFHALVALKIRRLVGPPYAAQLLEDLASAPWAIKFVEMGAVGPVHAVEPKPCGPTASDAKDAIFHRPYAPGVPDLPLDDAPFSYTRHRAYAQAELAAMVAAKTLSPEASESVRVTGMVQVLQPVLHVASTSWLNAEQARLVWKSLSTAPVGSGLKDSGATLDDCVTLFSRREQLGDENRWRCPQCKEEVRAFKKLELWRLPPVLVVHLKRFSYGRDSGYSIYGGGSRGKVGKLVTFPIEGLDLSRHVLGLAASTASDAAAAARGAELPPSSSSSAPQQLPPSITLPGSGEGGGQGSGVYDLFAVSEHSGGLGGGHYTAVARNWDNGKWYSFNDSSVSPSAPQAAVSGAAYVLFYARRGYDHGRFAPQPGAGMTGAGGGPLDEEDEASSGGRNEDVDEEDGDMGGGISPSLGRSCAPLASVAASSSQIPQSLNSGAGSRSHVLALHAASGGGSSTPSSRANTPDALAARLAKGPKPLAAYGSSARPSSGGGTSGSAWAQIIASGQPSAAPHLGLNPRPKQEEAGPLNGAFEPDEIDEEEAYN